MIILTSHGFPNEKLKKEKGLFEASSLRDFFFLFLSFFKEARVQDKVSPHYRSPSVKYSSLEHPKLA